MEQLDQLIRLKATGNLEELAQKLNLSVSTVKRQIEIMKALGAPVYYNYSSHRYEYRFNVNFVYGFSYKEENIKKKKIKFRTKETQILENKS